MSEKTREICTVVSQESIGAGIYSMWIQTDRIAADAKPGQFVSLYTNDKSKILPRPISLCEIDKENGRLHLVYRVTGQGTGTDEFSQMKAGDTIPVLGTAVTEYGVALDIDNFDGLVGTNVSGTSDLAPLDQQAAMLNELFPDAKNVGLLYCSAEANSQYQVDTVQAALEDLGYTCKQYSFSDSNDLSSVTTTAADESDVIYVPTDNTVANNTEIVNNICQPAGVPIIAGEEGICKGCGVATLSISYYDLGVATGKMAVKILTGEADISEMPIEYAPQFTKEYNPTLCEALGVTVPDDYTAIAE